MMTAFGTPEVLAGALKLGAYRVLQKPFEVHDVAALVLEAHAAPTDESSHCRFSLMARWHRRLSGSRIAALYLNHDSGARRRGRKAGEMKGSIRLILVLLLVAVSGQAGFGQTPATRRVMREKLGHSQKILEAILTSNFTLLEQREHCACKATSLLRGACSRVPEYLRQSEAFLTALRELSVAAKDRDLDAAVSRYTALTTTCFACHRYMKDRRLARDRLQ